MQTRELETTITSKGQVTIPKKVRTQLGLKPKDKVCFELEGNAVWLRPAPSRIARHFGAVQVPGRALDAKSEREAFEQGVAEDVLAEDL